MRINYYKAILLSSSLSMMMACQNNNDSTSISNPIDSKLESTLDSVSSGQGKAFFTMPESTDYTKIPQDPKNSITAAKVALGQMLFHETGLGQNPLKQGSLQTYGCASCHEVKAGFQSCLPQGLGEGGIGFGVNGEARKKSPLYLDTEVDVQPVKSPSAMNIAYQPNILWNGQFGATHLNVNTQAAWTSGTPKEKNFLGFQGTEIQAIAGQNVHRLLVDKIFMTQIKGYKDLYLKAYDAQSLDNPTQLSINAGLAIAAYERTLLSNQAPFQLWLKGNYGAMTDIQKQGALLFFGKAQCGSCHTGPALSTMNFYALGMNDLKNGLYGNNLVQGVNPADPGHKGRGGFTGVAADMYKFKVPQLYNLKNSPFYGHGSSFTSIEQVINYKNAAKAENSAVPSTQLAKEFKPLNLTTNEVNLLVEFIKNGLYDPNLQRYVPTSLPSGLAFPDNDPQSRKDLGFK